MCDCAVETNLKSHSFNLRVNSFPHFELGYQYCLAKWLGTMTPLYKSNIYKKTKPCFIDIPTRFDRTASSILPLNYILNIYKAKPKILPYPKIIIILFNTCDG